MVAVASKSLKKMYQQEHLSLSSLRMHFASQVVAAFSTAKEGFQPDYVVNVFRSQVVAALSMTVLVVKHFASLLSYHYL